MTLFVGRVAEAKEAVTVVCKAAGSWAVQSKKGRETEEDFDDGES